MDHLDYGLAEPKLALMKDGGVFVAGQIQAPMDPPVMPRAMKWDANAKAFRSVAPGAAGDQVWTVGGSLMGTVSYFHPMVVVDFLTLNQGVERHLDDADQQSEDARLTWRKDVPKIAGRPAKIRIHLSGMNLGFGSGVAPLKPVRVRLHLKNSTGGNWDSPDSPEYLLSPPLIPFRFSKAPLNQVYTFTINDLSLLSDTAQIKVELVPDPADKISPSDHVNLYENWVNMGLKYTPEMEVHLVPLGYKPTGKPIEILSAAEVSQFQANTDLENGIKTYFPISHVKADGSPNLKVLVNPLAVSYTWDEAVKGKLYPPPASSDPWQVMLTELILANTNAGGAYERLNGQNNTYFMGLLRPIAGSTYPTTPGTTFTDGASQRGLHLAIVHAPLDVASKARAATTALHELGHSNGAAHAPFNVKKAIAKEWVNILSLITSYNSAGIGVYGQPVLSVPWRSLSAGDFLQGPNQKDIMSYSDPLLRWVSDYNWSIFAKQQKDNNYFVNDDEIINIP